MSNMINLMASSILNSNTKGDRSNKHSLGRIGKKKTSSTSEVGFIIKKEFKGWDNIGLI